MFGIVRPCRHRLCATLHGEWLSHLCGLCLTLRDEHGHRARLATNFDSLLISVLVEAQNPEPVTRRKAAACALRGMRGATVLSASDPGARLAAAVSLVLAAGKTRDHVADRDGALRVGVLAGAATRLADRWQADGARTGSAVDFDTDVLVDAVARQCALEDTIGPGSSVLTATEPTETAVSAAFAHTAVLAGTPANIEPLAEVGRYFGRIAHLLDAVEDYAEDEARGAFNPLRATGTDLPEARRLCDDAHRGLLLALDEATLRRPALARTLLVREVRYAIERTFAAHEPPHSQPRDAWAQDAPPSAQRPGDGAGAAGSPTAMGGVPGGYGATRGRPKGCAAPGLIGGACALTACTCGTWQPGWSDLHRAGCGDRCWCNRCSDGCSGPDCSGCDCGCGDCGCCDGCDCGGCCDCSC